VHSNKLEYEAHSFAAGGGAYYFAKRSIRADRNARHEADMKRRHRNEALEQSTIRSSPWVGQEDQATKNSDHSSNEARSHQTASTIHQSDVDLSTAGEKSKYVATEPYRRKQGDRFS
jgi:hypothetical protein